MHKILNLTRRNSCQIVKFCTETKPPRLPDDQKLLRELCGKIRFTGPITIAEYMREVLTNPVHGFYMDKTVLGSEGHFVTSPEISQMFGESIGVWFLNEWMKMGEPKEFQLVELGPGKGTLASDILRTIARVRPEALEGMSVHFVEISTKMRQLQEVTLCGQAHGEGGQGAGGHVSKFGPKVAWYQSLRDVPKKFSFFLAHEFFDALPVNNFQKTADGWREVLIDIDPSVEGSKLRYVIARNATPACVLLEQPGVVDLMKGREKVELSTQGGTLVREISERVAEKGGIGLIADYGHTGEHGDTFRAYRKHQQVDPLDLPGTADLTADVDFGHLKSQVSSDCAWHGPATQGTFLHSCGISTRAQQLLDSTKDMYVHKNILESYDTLTNPEKMGTRFKFVSLFPATMSQIHEKYPPVGFTENEE